MASTERIDQPAEVASRVLRRAQVSKVAPVRGPLGALRANSVSVDDPHAAESPGFGQC